MTNVGKATLVTLLFTFAFLNSTCIPSTIAGKIIEPINYPRPPLWNVSNN